MAAAQDSHRLQVARRRCGGLPLEAKHLFQLRIQRAFRIRQLYWFEIRLEPGGNREGGGVLGIEQLGRAYKGSPSVPVLGKAENRYVAATDGPLPRAQEPPVAALKCTLVLENSPLASRQANQARPEGREFLEGIDGAQAERVCIQVPDPCAG